MFATLQVMEYLSMLSMQVTATEITEQTSSSDESEKENQLLKFDGSRDIAEESSTKLRQRVKQEDEHSSREIGPSVHSKAALTHHCSSSLSIIVSAVFIITILFAIVMGIWR